MKETQKKYLPLAVIIAVLCTLFAFPLTSYAKAGPSPYRAIALIQVPGWSDQQCFDIAFADGHRLYVADATANAVDVVDMASKKFTGRVGQGVFVGLAGCAQGDFTALGPDGVLATATELYAGDGNSTVKVFDLRDRHLVATIATGGRYRADEMVYDPQDNIVAVTNSSETIPFVSFIDTRTHRVVSHVAFPNAPQGLEQPAWDPITDTFYLSIPQAILPAAGHGKALDPSGVVASFRYSATTPPHITYIKIPACTPAGLALDTRTHTLAVGCATGEQALLSLGTTVQILARIPVSGADMVAYDPLSHHFFFAADGSLAVVDRDGSLLQRIPTVPGSHAAAVDRGHVFIPESGLGIMEYAQKPV